MSKVDVARFYELLSVNGGLAAEAMTFQQKYASQEEVISAFIALAAQQGPQKHRIPKYTEAP